MHASVAMMRAYCFTFVVLSLLVIRAYGAPSEATALPSCAVCIYSKTTGCC